MTTSYPTHLSPDNFGVTACGRLIETDTNVTRQRDLVTCAACRASVDAPDPHAAALDALEAALPLLIRLGDFVGNADVDPGRVFNGTATGLDRCAVIMQVREALRLAGRTP